MLSPSSLYTVWLQKLFWTGDPQLIKQAPQSSPEWLHAYDVCLKYFDRLCPDDLISIVDAITFSPEAVSKVTEKVFEGRLRVLWEKRNLCLHSIDWVLFFSLKQKKNTFDFSFLLSLIEKSLSPITYKETTKSSDLLVYFELLQFLWVCHNYHSNILLFLFLNCEV